MVVNVLEKLEKKERKQREKEIKTREKEEKKEDKPLDWKELSKREPGAKSQQSKPLLKK